MTKSDQIRMLAAQGMSTADIARKIGIRYQHAYNVIKDSGALKRPQRGAARNIPSPSKPTLTAARLLDAGFQKLAHWVVREPDGIELTAALPRTPGTYAFAVGGIVQYVGVATMGLSKRIYFYGKPGVSQRTSLRLNAIILELVKKQIQVDVLVAQPSNLSWNGLPVNGAAGLELGLIKQFDLPWNKRSSN